MKEKKIFHLIRRERTPGSRRSVGGESLMPAISLPDRHSPAKILRATTQRRGRGRVTGRGPVQREPKPGMMVKVDAYDGDINKELGGQTGRSRSRKEKRLKMEKGT